MKISQSWILAYDRVLDDTPTLASGRFILPLSGYKALVNKSSGETFILEEKFGRALPLVCASSGL